MNIHSQALDFSSQNNLDKHIQFVLGIYSQRVYNLEKFPYQAIFDEWFVSGGPGRCLASN